MEPKNHDNKELIAKFQKAYESSKVGGIFTTRTRERLLGISGLSGRNRTKDDFWYDVRAKVKTALIDLQLFLEMAGENNVNLVVTQESLVPIVYVLLWHPVVAKADPDVNRAEIAQLFVKWGFEYLSCMAPDLMTLSHEQTRAAAVDLANFLTESLKPKEERRYSTPRAAMYY